MEKLEREFYIMDTLSIARELIGCGLMFLAVIFVQLPERKK